MRGDKGEKEGKRSCTQNGGRGTLHNFIQFRARANICVYRKHCQSDTRQRVNGKRGVDQKGERYANCVCFTVRRRMKSLTRNKHTKTKELVVPCLSLPFPFPPLKKEKEIRISYSRSVETDQSVTVHSTQQPLS